MATVEYAPHGVCARLMKFEVEDGKLHNLSVVGGCNGNLQGISKLTEGMELGEIVSRLEGIRCGAKPTSCPDQLAKALREYMEGDGNSDI